MRQPLSPARSGPAIWRVGCSPAGGSPSPWAAGASPACRGLFTPPPKPSAASGFNPSLSRPWVPMAAARPRASALLAELGVNESSAGCPVRCEMETVVLGTNSFGLPIHFDQNAFDADGIILLNRIKPHTSFTGLYESGLLKMLTIGLGKRQGAAQVHKLGLPGLKTMLPEVGAFLLERTPVALGIAILENAFEHTARIVAVEPEELLEVEPRLLDQARELMGRLPFDQIDVLIVGELGKNYSGTGLDPNVIGRQRVETMPDLPRPVITRLAVLDLSVETRGNALGIGLADLTTDRLVQAIDPVPMRVNSLTSNFLTRASAALAADRPGRDLRLPSDLLANRARPGPPGFCAQYTGADHFMGHATLCRRGRGSPGARLRDRLSAHATGRCRQPRARAPFPRERAGPAGASCRAPRQRPGGRTTGRRGRPGRTARRVQMVTFPPLKGVGFDTGPAPHRVWALPALQAPLHEPQAILRWLCEAPHGEFTAR